MGKATFMAAACPREVSALCIWNSWNCLPHSWLRTGDERKFTYFWTKSLEIGSEIGSVNYFKKPDYQRLKVTNAVLIVL